MAYIKQSAIDVRFIIHWVSLYW